MKDLLTSSLVPAQPATPAKEFLLLPRTVTLQSGVQRTFTDGELADLVTAFKSLGRNQVIDYEHQTLGTMPGFEHFMSPDGTAPAAGWIGEMAVKPDGIWAQSVKWTPKASKMLADGEYRHTSPTIFWQGRPWVGIPKALGPVGLTNDPDINGLSAVAARATHEQLVTLMKESEMPDYKKLIAELMGLDANAPDEQFATACRSKWSEAGTKLTASKAVETELGQVKTALTTATTEVTALKTAHATEVTALKAAHTTEVAALKATHAGEVTALKSEHDKTKLALATQIADRFEETGRIATADKAAILEQAKTAPEIVLTAFKSVKVGAVVPVGTLGIKQESGDPTNFASPSDHVTASKAFKNGDASRQQLHMAACKYADQHKVSYLEAVNKVTAAQSA